MKSKIVLITGAAGGLGLEIVRIFFEKGYRVIATDLENNKIPGIFMNNNIEQRILDVTDPTHVNSLKSEFQLDNSGLDILINAAGVYDTYPVTEADPGMFRHMMAVNLHGTVNLIQGMLGPLLKNKGRVIVVSSESYRIQAMFQPYMISKASLEAFCHSARQELALKGVKLTVIRPGAIGTPLLNWMKSPVEQEKYPVYKKEIKKSWVHSVKMVGKITTPATVARVIYKAATVKNPKRAYHINNNPLLKIISILPGWLFDWLTIRVLRSK